MGDSNKAQGDAERFVLGGTLGPGEGKLADFVVLSEDLFAVDTSKIKDISIVRTVVGGATVYQA